MNQTTLNSVILRIKNLPEYLHNIIYNDYLHHHIIREMLLTPKTRLYNVVKMYFDSKHHFYKSFICGGMTGTLLFQTPRENVRNMVLTTYDLFKNYRQILTAVEERENQVQQIQKDDVIIFFNGKTKYAHRIIERCFMRGNRCHGFQTQPLHIECTLCRANKCITCTSMSTTIKLPPMEIEEEFLRSTVEFYCSRYST
jgi:hypothetical protein